MAGDEYGDFKCEECNASFFTDLGWSQHIGREHGGIDPRIVWVSCIFPACTFRFADVELMVLHCRDKHADLAMKVGIRPGSVDNGIRRIEDELAFVAWCEEHDRV